MPWRICTRFCFWAHKWDTCTNLSLPSWESRVEPFMQVIPSPGVPELNLGKAGCELGLGGLSWAAVSTEQRAQCRTPGLGFQLRPLQTIRENVTWAQWAQGQRAHKPLHSVYVGGLRGQPISLSTQDISHSCSSFPITLCPDLVCVCVYDLSIYIYIY